MATGNAFALLGDDENADPEQLAAAVVKPAPAKAVAGAFGKRLHTSGA